MRSWISIGGMGKWMGSQWQICKILRFSIAATPQDQGPNCQNVHLSVSTPASCFRKQQTGRPSPPHLCWSGIGGGKVVIAGGGVGVGFVHLAESWDYWRPVAPPLSLLLTSATTNFSLKPPKTDSRWHSMTGADSKLPKMTQGDWKYLHWNGVSACQPSLPPSLKLTTGKSPLVPQTDQLSTVKCCNFLSFSGHTLTTFHTGSSFSSQTPLQLLDSWWCNKYDHSFNWSSQINPKGYFKTQGWRI